MRFFILLACYLAVTFTFSLEDIKGNIHDKLENLDFDKLNYAVKDFVDELENAPVIEGAVGRANEAVGKLVEKVKQEVSNRQSRAVGDKINNLVKKSILRNWITKVRNQVRVALEKARKEAANVADKDADRLAARERRAVGERITSKMVDEAEEASKKIN